MKERKLQEIGKSLLVTVPKSWADELNLRKGSPVRMSVTDRGALMISPEFVSAKERKGARIAFDASGERRFFREYFGGADRIIIDLKGRARADLQSFLGGFMNVQVVEESEKRVVIKLFPVDEFSMEECLARMHFLSLGLFDEAAKGSAYAVRDSLEGSLTKFYYLLVLQVRGFLSEGRFASARVPLIRAMDMRMVAERIERMADILKRAQLRSWEARELELVKQFYVRAFGCFRDEDFDAAVPVWAEERALRKRIQSVQGMQLLRLAKEISSFVR